MKMTTEEAFVKVLQMHGIEHAFGIIGSAMMPISDLFPKAGISSGTARTSAMPA
jgi:sulfoacetaldehyde acetyltransferase